MDTQALPLLRMRILRDTHSHIHTRARFLLPALHFIQFKVISPSAFRSQPRLLLFVDDIGAAGLLRAALRPRLPAAGVLGLPGREV